MATVVFFPEGAFGPTNNCVGIAEVLAARGHRPVFVVEESFAGTLAARGFEERLVRLGPPPAQPQAPGQFWKDFIRDMAPVLRRPPIEQLEGFIAPTLQALIEGAEYVDPQLAEVLDDVDPDVTVVDNVVTFPAVVRRDRPWVRMMSCNPLELPDPALPPAYSGLPSDDPSGWAEFRDRADQVLGGMQARWSATCQVLGTPPLAPGCWMHSSPWLNLSLYPAELDYHRSQPPPEPWRSLDTNVRQPERDWEVPATFDPDQPIVYLSLGSLGGADVPLMQRLIDALAEGRVQTVVSMGPLHEQLRLPEGMVGEEFLPQPAVLARVDAVVTHGGNNTVTECLWYGRPMVVLPLFWDQHDNAQRVAERGFGIRLHAYELTPDELLAAVRRTLTDRGLRERCRAASERVRTVPGPPRAAHLLEELARHAGAGS